MTTLTNEIQQIAIGEITVLNPRARNRRVFNELVTSIAHLGLKKPITVSRRPDGNGYDLVCGQGRLEAFTALGETHIPAIVTEASEEDCFVMSLVENLARRHRKPLELIRDIDSLRQRGYSNAQIAEKTDFSEEYIYAIGYLLDHGEQRLLASVEKGVIPASIAMEIVRAKESEVQKALAEAYEQKTLPGNQILAIRRIIEQRNVSGKNLHGKVPIQQPGRKRVTAESLVRAYRKETERQQLLVKKASLA
jgi:ParB family chromosome partitioning protein